MKAAVSLAMPPGPRQSSIVQTIRMVRNPLPFMDECRRTFGEIFTLRLVARGDWIILSEPRHVRQMFTGDIKVMHAGEAIRRVFGPLIGNKSTVTLDEHAHLERRRLLTKPFHGDRMHEYTDAIQSIAEQVIMAWPEQRTFPLQAEMQRISFKVILRTMFGLERDDETGHLTVLLRRLVTEALPSPLLLMPSLQLDLGRFSPWGRIVQLVRETDVALYAEIRRRRDQPQDPSRRDILALLLATRDEAGNSLTDKDIRDELVAILFAGHETTAAALAWTVERLLAHPDAYARAEAECDLVIGGGPVLREHVPRLVFLDAVIHESLRVRPIILIAGQRKLQAPVELGDFRLPAGVTLANCIYLSHRRAESFPDPERFLPERFLGKTPDLYEWTPFGGGVRRCLGMAFALFEMKVVISTLLAKVRLKIDAERVRTKRSGSTLVPEGGPPVRVTEQRRQRS